MHSAPPCPVLNRWMLKLCWDMKALSHALKASAFQCCPGVRPQPYDKHCRVFCPVHCQDSNRQLGLLQCYQGSTCGALRR